MSLALACALIAGCSTTNPPATPSHASPSGTLADTASELLAHDHAVSAMAEKYVNALHVLSAHCAEPGAQLAIMIDTSVGALHTNDSDETRLAFMTTMAKLIGQHTSVDCTSAAQDLQSALDPSMGTPSTPAAIPLTKAPKQPTFTGTGTIAEQCAQQAWPQPIPKDIIGATLDGAFGALICFNVNVATAPDGHNVLDDAADSAGGWIVTGARPAPGTPVEQTTPVTLTVKSAN